MNASILLGTNQGNKESNLLVALKKIEERAGRIIRQSHIYETAAWGKTDQPGFYNMAIEIFTELTPQELIRSLLTIEKEMGRIRDQKWEQRIIDLDIIYYADRIIETKDLVIPHPEMQNRRFVLEPLNEIISAFVHPVLQKTVKALLEECNDKLPVTRLASSPL
jgi:2-amino-4-hydroxy-6-hydroxymethyldihydropteridine diphosphokinase